MQRDTAQLDRFLARVHRRWMLIRLLERIGIAMLVACAFALILAIILIARDSALGLTLVCLSGGLVIGSIIGIFFRPTLFDAATEVDRQLGLADLLGTALSVRRAQTVVADEFDAQWSSTILALAETRCATIANEPLMLRRFGMRAWGGIGLCSAIVLTLGILSTNPLLLQARPAPQDSQDLSTVTGAKARIRSGNTASQRSEIADAAPSVESGQRSRIDSQTSRDSSASAASDPRHSPGAAQDQVGSGAGRTEHASTTSLQQATSTDAGGTSAGEVSAGGGRTNPDATAGHARAGGEATQTSGKPVPPWNQPDWPRAQEQADHEVHHGTIPDAYRDLIADYFAR